MKRCVILGGGGHSKVIIEAMRASKEYEPKCILDLDEKKWNKEILGVRVLGGDNLIKNLKTKGIKYFTVGIGSVKDNKKEKKFMK